MTQNDSGVAPCHQQPPAKLASISLLLGIVLVLLVSFCGGPRLDATWIQGDERYFIANNPDVTGEGRSQPPWLRYLQIFDHFHGDLYQPLPILTYALEWDLWGPNRVTYMRLTDVLLHAANGLLLWAVLCALLGHFVPRSDALTRYLMSYALALIWVLHPINVSAYAADMGRTHLLSSFFLLLATLAQLSALRRPWLSMSLAMLFAFVLANLSKPIVGWVAVAVLIEVQVSGWAAALRSWRVWATGVIGVAGAIVTLSATHEAQMFDELDTLVFGDRFSRSLFSVWLHLHNVAWPTQLSVWYLPDPRAVWSHPLVWSGGLITLISVIALFAALAQRRHGLSTGITWFWIVLLPVLGLVGARVAAGNDRYIYVPLMGLLLLIGLGLAHLMSRLSNNTRPRILVATTLVVTIFVGIIFVPMNTYLTNAARSSIERARHTVQIYPDQYRAYEMLARAYSFSTQHETYELLSEGEAALNLKAREALDQAVAIAEKLPERFATPHERANFHRRTAMRYLVFQAVDEAFEQAKQAAAIEPNAPTTLTALAQTSRARQDWVTAAQAYAALERHTSPDAPFQNLRLIEFADLLLYRLNQPAEALPRFRKALEDPTLTDAQRAVARSGLALAEIRAGLGQRGFELVSELLEENPGDPALLLILGEYHLRSHHFEDALQTYGRLITRDPTNLRALRGLHSAAAELNEYDVAVNAWALAVQADPQNRVVRSFLAWAMASGGSPEAEEACQTLLEAEPHNPFASFGQMLIALRNGDLESSVQWLEMGLNGQPIPDAQAPARAATTLERLAKRQALAPEAFLLAAGLWKSQGVSSRAQTALVCYYEATNPDKHDEELAPEITSILQRLELSMTADEAWGAFRSNSQNCY